MSMSVENGDRTGTDWASAHPRKEWFHVRELSEGVHVISEPGHVNSYLIQGSEIAVLLDTGLGVANIRQVAEQLTEQPIHVINSHYHFDHSGGNLLFENIAIHHAGAELLSRPASAGLASAYMEYTQRLLGAWGNYKRADDLYFHLLTSERLLRPLPEDFDPATFKVLPSTPTRLLRDNEIVDLGGRELRVLHTPGHSPDSICLVDEMNGLLFGGDTINTGPIYAQLEDSDVFAFARSTARLSEISSSIRRVFVCHFMRIENEPVLLQEIADGFDQIVNDTAICRESFDSFEYPVKEACFDNFSVYLPGVSESPRF